MSLREEKKQQTRTAILEAARVSFRKKGYEATTVRDLAKTVRVTEPTFYNYFADKKAVLDAIAYEWLATSVTALSKPGASAKTFLRRYAMRQCDLVIDDPDFARLVFIHSSLFDNHGGEQGDYAAKSKAARSGFDALSQVISQGQARGEITRKYAAEDMAIVLHASVVLMMKLWVTGYWDKPTDLSRKVRKTLDMIFEGLQEALG